MRFTTVGKTERLHVFTVYYLGSCEAFIDAGAEGTAARAGVRTQPGRRVMNATNYNGL
jgi:hypothetical protein